MEVEHFEDKKNNPDKVVDWDNLLPSCKKCNGSKSSHDVVNDPIVNPYDDDPRDHFALRCYRLRGKSVKGNTTIVITNLNHSERLVNSRFMIGEKMHALVETAWDRFGVYKQNGNVKSKNRLITIVEELLKECQPKANYAASTSTLLLTDQQFLQLISEMKAHKIWIQALEEAYQEASLIVLDCA
jgi:hypothetical protein